MKGRWCYLYRAIDSTGATIDFLLSALRDATAAKRLFRKALTDPSHPQPRVINTDQARLYGSAIAAVKKEGTLRRRCRHRPVQYLNNILEQDHRAIKRRGDRAARIMAATAEAAPELKRLAGVAATGRKLEKPVCHYSLSWAKDEKPHRQEMRRAAQESLKALGMKRHQALVVSHRDGQPHVHVIANRVDPESGKAAGLNRSKLKLSKWAEEYERGQGKIRCPQRERNNARRGQGKRVQDRVSRPTGRHRREEMSPQREQREAIPAGRDGWGGPERERVAWQRAEERGEWEQLQRRRGKALGELEKRSKREWSALYGRHQRQREQLAKDCRGVLGRFRAELEDRLRWERVSLGKAHSEAVRGIESKAGEFYREGLQGSEKRAREAARSDGLLLSCYSRPDEFYRLKYSMLEERLEQVREIDGELAYEKMRRAVEKASQEKASQEKARQVERARQERARQSRERRGPERRGPERDFGPSR